MHGCVPDHLPFKKYNELNTSLLPVGDDGESSLFSSRNTGLLYPSQIRGTDEARKAESKRMCFIANLHMRRVASKHMHINKVQLYGGVYCTPERTNSLWGAVHIKKSINKKEERK